MDTAETPQQTLDETGENRDSNSGTNAETKYVNGEIDNMPQQQSILTTIPLDVALQSSTSEPAGVSIKQKRDSHNEIERRRKCKINIGIIKLGEIIPSCINAKLSKNQILEHAANHVIDLTAKCEKLLTSSASETQAEEIKNLMKENERLRNENKRFQEMMKTLQIPPNGVANPAAFFKSKAKLLAQKAEGKVVPISKNNSNVKPVVTNQNAAQMLQTNQNVTILASNNQITGSNQIGTNQVVNQGAGLGNAILVQNPNGGYFLVPANKNVTIPVPGNQVSQSIAPNPISVPTVVSSQVGTTTSVTVNSVDGLSQVIPPLTTTSVASTTVTTQCVSTPIATSTPQGASVQAPGMVQTIRYLVPMMQGGQGNQTQNQTMMVMAKPNQSMPLRIAPQQPIRMAGSQQVILPQPAGIPVSSSQNIEKINDCQKKSSQPKIKSLCSTDSDSDNGKSDPSVSVTSQAAIAPAPVGVQSIAPNPVNVGTGQVVLQRPPVQTNTVNQNMMTMQVVPKPVTQQLVYLQGPNGQLIPVMIQNPNGQSTTLIQQPAQPQQTVGASNQLVTIPINQGQNVIHNRPLVVVSQPATMSPASGVITSQNIQGTVAITTPSTSSVITSVSSSNTIPNSVMSPLSVLTPQQNNTPENMDSGFSNPTHISTGDILAKAAESIFSPNSLNDNSPTLNLHEMSDTNVTTGVVTATTTTSTTQCTSSVPPIPIHRTDDPVHNLFRQVSLPDTNSSVIMPPAPEIIDAQEKKQKKSKKKKKKKEKNKDKTKDKDKDKDKIKHKHKDEQKEKIDLKSEEDTLLIKELDRGIANSIDTLPDSTSGTAIITDMLLQEWIEKEAGLTNTDQDGENTEETITNVTPTPDKEEMDQGQTLTTNPSSFSTEALLAENTDTSPPNQLVPPTTSTSSTSTPATTVTETTTTTTTNSHNPFGSFPVIFGSDILSSSMSVSGLPTYIEDETADEGKSSNNGLNSLKALGSMRDSILSFGGSQTSLSQTGLPHQQIDQANNQDADISSDRSKSVSPVQSLPTNPPTPAPRGDSSPESTHGFSSSPGQTTLFGTGTNLLPDNLESKGSTQAQEEDSLSDTPQSEPSSFPASHNSSWISHHSRASHLASGLKKQKPPAPPSSLPIANPVSTACTDSTINTSGPAGFYTLPWLSPVTPIDSSRTTPTSQISNTENNGQPEKPTSVPMPIPTPPYLSTQRSSSPSCVPHPISVAAYVPPQRTLSPTYIPTHRSTSPAYLPRVTSQSSLSVPNPLTIDTSVSHPIFSTSSQLSTPSSRSVITTMSQLGTTVSTTNSNTKLKPRLSMKKFSPSTIHRTLTSGITEDSSEKPDEDSKIESRPQKEQQKEWQHKLPMQVKPGPDIRAKEGQPLTGANPSSHPGLLSAHAKPPKKKRSRKKHNPETDSGKEAPAEITDVDRANLEDIGKRELPKNLVDQFPWLAEAEGEKKSNQNLSQLDRSTSFSIQSITQQTSHTKSNTPVPKSLNALPIPNLQIGNTSTESQSRISSCLSQVQESSAQQPFWNPSTSCSSFQRTTESMTSTSMSKQSSAIASSTLPNKGSKIEYTSRQSSNYGPSAIISSNNVSNDQSPVPLPNFSVTTNQRELQSPANSQASEGSDNQDSSNKSRKPGTHKKQLASQKQTQPSEAISPMNSSPDSSSNSPLFTEFHLAPHLAIASNLMSNSSLDSRTPTVSLNQQQQSSSQTPPLAHQPPRSSAITGPPTDNFLFSPTNSSSGASNQSSVFPNQGTNRSDNNQPEGEDSFMAFAPADKSLDFLANSPDQSQNVDTIDLSSLPMFDTPTTTPTPTSTQSNIQPSVQSSAQSQSHQPVSGRASTERQPNYEQSPSHQPNMRQPGQGGRQMYSMQNTGHSHIDGSQGIAAHNPPSPALSQVQSRFLPSPEMHQQSQGTKRTASESNHHIPAISQAQSKFIPSPEMHQQSQSIKRTASEGNHHTQASNTPAVSQAKSRFLTSMPSPEVQQQSTNRNPSESNPHPTSHTPTLSQVQSGFMPSPEIHSQTQGAKSQTQSRFMSSPEIHSQTQGAKSQTQSRFMPSPEMHPQSQGAKSQTQSRFMPSPEIHPQSQGAKSQIQSRFMPLSEMHQQSQGTKPQAQTRFMTAIPSPEMQQQSQGPKSLAQNRFITAIPSPEMQQTSQGTKRPASEHSHPAPNPKRTAIAMHHNQLSVPHMHGHESHRSVVLERASAQSAHIHRVDQGTHRGQTPPSTQQVGSPHSAPQQNRNTVECQAASRVPTYDLTQSVAHQITRSGEVVPSSRSDPHRVPSYDLTQSIAPQRNRTVERQTSASETQRLSTYNLIQNAGAQRTRSVERQTSASETQRIPTYDLTQSAGTQRTRSVERTPSSSETQRTPVYDLSQSAGVQRNSVERQHSRSETQRVPTYDLSQSAGAQRTRSTERPTTASETQRISTYNVTQSSHRNPVPSKQRKRQQNNTEQYFPSSDTTSSLRHMDSSIAQESNPWPGFPPQRMPSVATSESSLSSPPFLPNFTSPVSQSLPSSINQSETVASSSSASIVPSLSPSRRIRSDMPTYLPHPHIASILPSPPQGSKSTIGREAEISTPFNPMFPPSHARAGLGMNVPPNFAPVFHDPHQHAPPPFNVTKAQLSGGVGVHPTFNFNNIFNDMSGPNTSHSDTPTGLPVHAMHLHGNPSGMSVEDSMAHMRGNVPSRHVHGHPQAFGNNMRIDSLLGQNVSADGRTFKVGVPMGAPFHAASFGPGMPF